MSDRTIKSLAQALTVLGSYSLLKREKRYDLTRVKALLDYLHNPQDQIRVVHVAGTSGKTSTAYFIAGLLREHGMRVGLTVSPHVTGLNERVQIDGSPLSEQEFCLQLCEFLDVVDSSSIRPTFFEIMTTFAYWCFSRPQLDIAVVETGVGGLLDPSNVVTRRDKICVITDIGMDHTDVLGSSLEEIAFQKAGIIHPGNLVIVQHQDERALDVIFKHALEYKAEVIVCNKNSSLTEQLLPIFQRRNFALASTVYSNLLGSEPLSPSTLGSKRNLPQLMIPGRFETFSVNDRLVILDGAHNGQKMRALVESLVDYFPNQTFAALLAVKQGKDFKELLTELTSIACSIVCTGFSVSSNFPFCAMQPVELADYLNSELHIHADVEENVELAFKLALNKRADVIVVTGSLYLVSEVRGLICSAIPAPVVSRNF